MKLPVEWEQALCRAVSDAMQDPVYSPLDLLVHRTALSVDDCVYAFQLAHEQDLLYIRRSGGMFLLKAGEAVLN